MNRFDDGIQEWREDKATETDYREQRKANYIPQLEYLEKGAAINVEDGGDFAA